MNFIKNHARTLVLVALFSASVFMAVAGGPVAVNPLGDGNVVSGKTTAGVSVPVAVDATGKLETTAVVSVGSISVAVTPAYMEDQTTASSAILTADGYVPVAVMNPPETTYIALATATTELTVADKFGRVSGTERYNAVLATNSVTLLSAVCSFTPPVEITFNHKAASWIGDADMASGTIQTMEKHAADTWWSIKVTTAGYDLGMIADPAAIANVAISVHTLAQ